MRLRLRMFLMAAAVILGVIGGSTAAAPCKDQQDVLCGYYCSSNSCVSDLLSRPEDACWLDITTIPITCEMESPYACCTSGPGM